MLLTDFPILSSGPGSSATITTLIQPCASQFYLLRQSESESRSVLSDSLRPHGLYSPWNSPAQNTGVGGLSLLQRIFSNQGSNPGLPQRRQILYQLSHKGSPRILQWIAYPFNGTPLQYPCLENPLDGGACSPWGHKELNTTERLHFHFSLSCIGEGNGNPLQRSCLENPRDSRAWWAAVYGVTESDTTEVT